MIVGDHRDQAEQHDQPDVQPRAGEAAAPLGPDLHEPLGDEAPSTSSSTRSRLSSRKSDRAAARTAARRSAPDRSRRPRRAPPAPARQRACAEADPAAQIANPLRQLTHASDASTASSHDATAPAHRSRRQCSRSGYFRPRTTWMSNSRIFLRRVLRLRPSSCAALIWLPRVAPRRQQDQRPLDLAQHPVVEPGRPASRPYARRNSRGDGARPRPPSPSSRHCAVAGAGAAAPRPARPRSTSTPITSCE